MSYHLDAKKLQEMEEYFEKMKTMVNANVSKHSEEIMGIAERFERFKERLLKSAQLDR